MNQIKGLISTRPKREWDILVFIRSLTKCYQPYMYIHMYSISQTNALLYVKLLKNGVMFFKKLFI